jgi:hypothetical protein
MSYFLTDPKVTSHSRRHTIRFTTAYQRRRDLAVAAHRIWEVSLVLAA